MFSAIYNSGNSNATNPQYQSPFFRLTLPSIRLKIFSFVFLDDARSGTYTEDSSIPHSIPRELLTCKRFYREAEEFAFGIVKLAVAGPSPRFFYNYNGKLKPERIQVLTVEVARGLEYGEWVPKATEIMQAMKQLWYVSIAFSDDNELWLAGRRKGNLLEEAVEEAVHGIVKEKDSKTLELEEGVKVTVAADPKKGGLNVVEIPLEDEDDIEQEPWDDRLGLTLRDMKSLERVVLTNVGEPEPNWAMMLEQRSWANVLVDTYTPWQPLDDTEKQILLVCITALLVADIVMVYSWSTKLPPKPPKSLLSKRKRTMRGYLSFYKFYRLVAATA